MEQQERLVEHDRIEDAICVLRAEVRSTHAMMRGVMGLAGPPLLVAALMVFQTASAQARSKQHPWTCEPGQTRQLEKHVKARVRLLMADTHAEVYETNEIEGAPEGGWVLAGCAYGNKRGYVLGSVSSGSGSAGASDEPVTLVGTLLATRFGSYSTVGFGPEHTTGISVIDLRSGRRIRSWSTTEGVGIATAVLKPDGAIAWITASYVNTETGFHQESVYAEDNDGLRLLARGSNIEDNSLALGGKTVYWMQGGIAHSALLN